MPRVPIQPRGRRAPVMARCASIAGLAMLATVADRADCSTTAFEKTDRLVRVVTPSQHNDPYAHVRTMRTFLCALSEMRGLARRQDRRVELKSA